MAERLIRPTCCRFRALDPPITCSRLAFRWFTTFEVSDLTFRTITSPAFRIASSDRSPSTNSARGIRLAREALRFAVEGRGALTFGVTTAQVFCRSTPEKASPDLQLLFTPASYDASKFGELEREDGMTVAVCPVRPDSRGTIMARSPDAAEKPVITPNYLSDPADFRVLSAGIRFTRAIFASPAIAAFSSRETLPGPAVTTDEALLDYARGYGTTIYHPVGTCRMGDGPAAVVDITPSGARTPGPARR